MVRLCCLNSRQRQRFIFSGDYKCVRQKMVRRCCLDNGADCVELTFDIKFNKYGYVKRAKKKIQSDEKCRSFS